jgi:predicted transporter
LGERRVAGVAGLVFAVSTVLQFVVAPSPPTWDASGSEIRGWFVDHRTGVLIQGFLMVASVLFLIVFVVGVYELLRSATGTAAIVAALGGAIVAATLLVGQAVFNAAVWINGNADASRDDTLRLAWSIGCLLIYGASMPGIVLLTGAVAVAGRRTNALPVWSVRVAAVVAVLGLAGNLIQFGPGFAWFGLAAFLGLVLFSVALAVPMVTRNRGALGGTASVIPSGGTAS